MTSPHDRDVLGNLEQTQALVEAGTLPPAVEVRVDRVADTIRDLLELESASAHRDECRSRGGRARVSGRAGA